MALRSEHCFEPYRFEPHRFEQHGAEHRFAPAVSRVRGRVPVVLALLLAVAVTLFGPVGLGGSEPSAVGGGALAADARSAHSESQAENAENVDPALTTAAVRHLGEATGERHAPPVPFQGAGPRPEVGSLRPARPPVAAEDPPVSGHPAHRHGVRAPPSPSGI